MLRFSYRLAFHMDKLDPVGEVLFKLNRRQLCYWMAFLQLEPPAADRDDVRGASHMAYLADRLTLPDEVTDPNDLILKWAELSERKATAKPDRVEEADALILAINSRFKAV